MYRLVITDTFWSKYRLLVKAPFLKKKVVKSLKLLAENPRYPSLHSHKVLTKHFGEKWSSKLTGNLRVIWDYNQDKELTILVLTLGSHTGKHKIYQ